MDNLDRAIDPKPVAGQPHLPVGAGGDRPKQLVLGDRWYGVWRAGTGWTGRIHFGLRRRLRRLRQPVEVRPGLLPSQTGLSEFEKSIIETGNDPQTNVRTELLGPCDSSPVQLRAETTLDWAAFS